MRHQSLVRLLQDHVRNARLCDPLTLPTAASTQSMAISDIADVSFVETHGASILTTLLLA